MRSTLFFLAFLVTVLRLGLSNLIYPEGASKVQFIAGFGFPLQLNEESLVIGVVMKFNYQVPQNSSEITQNYVTFAKRSIPENEPRWIFYRSLETVLDRMGIPGRECILRSICEAAGSSLKHEGIIGEVIHLVLTPSASEEAPFEPEAIYHKAEVLGRSPFTQCGVHYAKCPLQLIDFVTHLSNF